MAAAPWWSWHCWVCQDAHVDSSLEVEVQSAKGDFQKPLAPPLASPRDQERSRLRELVKTFVHRGMEGVFCELVDETGSTRSGMYHIDERLNSVTFELVEDNVGPRAKHVVPFCQVSEVLRPEDGEAPFSGALKTLNAEQRKKLLKVVYHTEHMAKRHVCFLEATNSDRQRFMTCVRILRRYMDEQSDQLMPVN